MNLSIIAKDLFNKIRGQFPSVQLGDSQGTITKKPEEARFFDFDFNHGGNTLGKVSISISEEDGLVVLHNKDFTEGTDEAVKNAWYGFLKEMGQFAKARVLGFDTRDITKSNLEKRDYEFLGKEKEVEQVSESNLYGTTKTSFQSVGEARLVIKHSAPVDQTVAGGRSHKIESIFIESNAGERFKYPIKHLNGARAMARHVSEGGNPFDSFGKHIIGLSEELSKLRSFKTYINRSNVMAEGLKEYQSIVDERIDTIKNECQKLQRATAYKETFENFKESTLEEVPEDIKKNWIDELTIKTFKEELQDVFPYIYKLVTEKTAVQSLDPESFEAHGYQGGTEPRKYEYDLVGDFEPEKAVTDKDAMDVKELLNKAGIEADVQPNEMRYQGIVIHTDAPRDAVEKVLGGMIETLNTADSFNEFEDAMESIVAEDNELFSNDPEEKDQAIKRLNALMAKHFPVGVNGTNGIESLAGIIDDEEFNDSIRNASKENSDACLRPMIMDYVMKRDPQVATRLDTGDMDNEPKNEEKGKRSGVEITPELKEKVQAWWDKWNQNKYEAGNGNTMAEGYLQYYMNTGIGTDFFNADEYIAVQKEMGIFGDEDRDAEYELGAEKLMKKMPLTRQCEDEIEAITGKAGEDSARIVQDVVKYFIEKESTVKEMGDAETEISDGIFVVQRGDNADGVSDEDPYVVGELYADPELSAEDIQKTLQDYVQSKNLAPKVDFRPDDSGSSVIDGKAYRGEVVMNWLGGKPITKKSTFYKAPHEAITFEDIKPYVSMYKGDDGKTVFDVLNKDGDSVKKFSDAKAAMEYLHKNFDALRKGEVQKENPEANQDMSMDYEFTGDDGEMAYGTLHYKVVNGQVDPNSLRGESEYNGNHKVDDEFATDMVKPGGSDHEDALQAAQDDYDYESDRMRSKFEKADDVVADKSTEVEEFVKSFYDYTNNQFPKGETAVITAVEKKFGDAQIKTAQEAIAKLMSDKDPKMSRIKKLAGIQ